MKFRRQIFRRLGLLLASSSALILVLVFRRVQSRTTDSSVSSSDAAFFEALRKAQPKQSVTSGSGLSSNYCDADDIVHGTWRVDRNFADPAALFRAYGLKDGADTKCEPLAPDISPESGLARVMAVAKPSLKPARDCKMLQMTSRVLFRRLLRAPAGLTIVGDSISQNTFQIWTDMLMIEPGLVRKTKQSASHWTLEFQPQSKLAPKLCDELGISPERLAFPIVTFFRTDQILEEEELIKAVADAGVRAVVNVDKEANGWFPIWKQMLKDSSGAKVRDGKEETSLIVLNTGSFWTSKSLGGKMTESDVDAGYQNMFNIMKRKIREVPYPVASYWRSLTPAHLDCAESHGFNNTQVDWASPISGNLKSWNYHWYERLNGIAEGNTVHHRRNDAWAFDSIRSKRDVNPPMRFLNVWEMTLKRPEAHVRPPQDCLHLCMVGVMNYWQELLWNAIVQESRHSDYEGLS